MEARASRALSGGAWFALVVKAPYLLQIAARSMPVFGFEAKQLTLFETVWFASRAGNALGLSAAATHRGRCRLCRRSPRAARLARGSRLPRRAPCRPSCCGSCTPRRGRRASGPKVLGALGHVEQLAGKRPGFRTRPLSAAVVLSRVCVVDRNVIVRHASTVVAHAWRVKRPRQPHTPRVAAGRRGGGRSGRPRPPAGGRAVAGPGPKAIPRRRRGRWSSRVSGR